MSPAPTQRHWSPELPPEDDWSQRIPISDTVRYLICTGRDERGELAEWAVVQERLLDGHWIRVAVYDHAHDKGIHRHLYDQFGNQFDETSLRPVHCRRDFEAGLDYCVDSVVERWEENERRSDCGR